MAFQDLHSCLEEHCTLMASQSITLGCWSVCMVAEDFSSYHLGPSPRVGGTQLIHDESACCETTAPDSSSVSLLYHTKNLCLAEIPSQLGEMAASNQNVKVLFFYSSLPGLKKEI